MRSFFLLLGLAMPLFAVRLESTRLAAEASVWFEPNHGQVGGRTEWTARAAGVSHTQRYNNYLLLRHTSIY